MPPSPERDNAQWLSELTGDGAARAQAQQALRDVLVQGLHRALSKRGVSEALIDDFAQEALLRILEHLGEFRGESRFTTWALSVALRVAYRELRGRPWRDVPLEHVSADARTGQPLIPLEPFASASTERALTQRQILALLQAVVERDLSERQRMVIVAQLRGVPLDELARKLSTNRNALYKLVYDARRKLQLALEREGLTGEQIRWAFEK